MGSELIGSKPKRQAGLHMFVRPSQGWGTCGHILKEVPTLVLYLTHYNGRIDYQNLVLHPNNEIYIHDKMEVACSRLMILAGFLNLFPKNRTQ